ncbi:hypothetical protein GSI_11806 [Ganoderma sinense ZZ0214-1]|uniref:Uncharacterized protein n=1 Tax=Ganoderma sinense ZZ0214-1 TaxID=1077348 RepID=A0A2G8RX16_9APHY|nr:hypothetical protein GSI_11806 [Ganoderma sinense ZZ0214-1]
MHYWFLMPSQKGPSPASISDQTVKDTCPGRLVQLSLAANSPTLNSLVSPLSRDVHQSVSLNLDLGVGTLTAVECVFATPTNGGVVAE